MQPLIEYTLDIGGFETRALELEGDGPPLVLLHGYADSADTWRLALDGLARRERRAIALDLPGFGRAGRLRQGEPLLPQLDAFVAAAVEQVASEHGDALLVGNSLGGCVALRAAQDEALPIRGVVPVAPAGFDMPRWFRIIEADPLVRSIVESPIPLPSPLVRGVVAQAYRNLVFARPRAIDRSVVAGFTSHFGTKTAVAGHLSTGRQLLPELGDGCFELERIEAPVLLIWGDRDRMVTHRGSRRLLAALPDTEYELYPGVGHCPQIEAPERFVASLERFLAKVAASR